MNYEKRISLRENHHRSLSSTLMIVEQLLIEIENLLTSQYKTCCHELKNDVDSEKINHNLKVIENARVQICKLAEKYNMDKKIQSLQRIIDVKKTKIWEILCDAKSKKQKGFGKFPQELVKEFDKDIDEMLAVVDQIRY